MSVLLTPDGEIALRGRCGSEDAGPLLEHLLTHPDAKVDWRDCEFAHTAVVQVLLASRRTVLGPAADSFLTPWVEPLLGPG